MTLKINSNVLIHVSDRRNTKRQFCPTSNIRSFYNTGTVNYSGKRSLQGHYVQEKELQTSISHI